MLLGKTTDPEGSPKICHNSAGSGVLLSDQRGHLCLTHCSLTPSKWNKIFLRHIKSRSQASSKTWTVQLLWITLLWIIMKSVRLLFIYPRTIKTFTTGLPLCKISWCIEQFHIVTWTNFLRTCNRVLTAYVQYRSILFFYVVLFPATLTGRKKILITHKCQFWKRHNKSCNKNALR